MSEDVGVEKLKAIFEDLGLNAGDMCEADVDVIIAADHDSFQIGAHVWVQHTDKHAIISGTRPIKDVTVTGDAHDVYVCVPGSSEHVPMRSWAGESVGDLRVVEYESKADNAQAMRMLEQWPDEVGWSAAKAVFFCRTPLIEVQTAKISRGGEMPV